MTRDGEAGTVTGMKAIQEAEVPGRGTPREADEVLTRGMLIETSELTMTELTSTRAAVAMVEEVIMTSVIRTAVTTDMITRQTMINGLTKETMPVAAEVSLLLGKV